MQRDIVLKKLIFDILTPRVRGGGLRAKYLLPCCWHAAFCDSFYFDLQHDHVLKKSNFDLLTPSPGSGNISCTLTIAESRAKI